MHSKRVPTHRRLVGKINIFALGPHLVPFGPYLVPSWIQTLGFPSWTLGLQATPGGDPQIPMGSAVAPANFAQAISALFLLFLIFLDFRFLERLLGGFLQFADFTPFPSFLIKCSICSFPSVRCRLIKCSICSFPSVRQQVAKFTGIR